MKMFLDYILSPERYIFYKPKILISNYMKKKYYWIIGIVVILLIIIDMLLVGFPLGMECGHWDAFGRPQKSCECIGIKTGVCPFFAMCDSGTFGCIGVCQSCVCKQFNVTNHEWEIIPCD